VEIDFKEAAAINKTLYKNQVVISFDGRVNSVQAREWIKAYNKVHTSHSLRFQEPLIHLLFVVLVHSAAPSVIVEHLIRDSPIKVAGHHASVNTYSADFKPKQPIDFKQLVNIQITDGTLFIYSYLYTTFKQIGKTIVDTRAIGQGSDHHKITALIQTTLQDFPTEVAVRYSLTNQLLIKIGYVKQLRCPKCFSFEHTASACCNVDKTQVINKGKQNLNEDATPKESTPKQPKSTAETKPTNWNNLTAMVEDSQVPQEKRHPGQEAGSVGKEFIFLPVKGVIDSLSKNRTIASEAGRLAQEQAQKQAQLLQDRAI
jgi:hypothetical protein